MTECIIENGFIVDDVESVIDRIREISKKSISGIETIKRFIIKEKNTKFYIDSKLNTQMERDDKSVYVWLDTGYVDTHGNAIFISLLKNAKGFIGHVVGTISELCNNIKSFFRLAGEAVKQKIHTIKNKYEKKACERAIKHIQEEKQYILQAVNSEDVVSPIALKLQALGLLDDAIEEHEEEVVEKEECFSLVEEKITMDLLFERLTGMEEYIQQLLNIIETGEKKSKEQIQELQMQNAEYKRALMQVRDFVGEEDNRRDEDNTQYGHNLLGNHHKILVIGGGELGTNIMQGIAKSYGFEKNDFEFIDFDKAKGFTDRIRRDGKYSAIIYGACPHKTAATAGYSSLLEKLRNTDGMPYVIDSRTTSGALKVTKESFRNSLLQVYEYLKNNTEICC